MIAFAVVTETIFAWPGMGKLLIDSIFQLDRPVVVAYLMVVVFMFVADQPGGRPPLLGARPARAAGGGEAHERRCIAAGHRRRARERHAARVRRAVRREQAGGARPRAARPGRLCSRCSRPGSRRRTRTTSASSTCIDARLPPGVESAGGGMTYWLGTDGQGRDMLSAILYGLRMSPAWSAWPAAVIALAIGRGRRRARGLPRRPRRAAR